MKLKQSLSPSSSTHIKYIEPNSQQQILPVTSREANNRESILELYQKFVTINSTVVVDFDESNLNIVEYDLQRKKYDYEQMMIDKLKQIENMAQIKRADHELQRRENKLKSMRKPVKVLLPEEQHYMTSFKRFNLNNKKKLFEDEILTDSEEEEDITNTQKECQGIHYYQRLKRHPKILEYTIEKIKSRQLSAEHQKKCQIQKRQAFKQQIEKIKASTVFAIKPKKIQKLKINPQKMCEDIYKKLYTKKGKKIFVKEAKKNVRLSKFISRQNQIVQTIDARSISKQSVKKLKEKFQQIVNQMYIGERKKRQSSTLPKLSTTLAVKFHHQ